MKPTLSCDTARELLVRLEPFGVRAEDRELVFDREPPEELLPVLCALHTGVRAELVRRPWWGCSSDRARMWELSTAAPLPDGVALLAVAGDERWDRLTPSAAADLPQLFAAPKATARRERSGRVNRNQD